jgi:hypothetical protein
MQIRLWMMWGGWRPRFELLGFSTRTKEQQQQQRLLRRLLLLPSGVLGLGRGMLLLVLVMLQRVEQTLRRLCCCPGQSGPSFLGLEQQWTAEPCNQDCACSSSGRSSKHFLAGYAACAQETLQYNTNAIQSQSSYGVLSRRPAVLLRTACSLCSQQSQTCKQSIQRIWHW